jgi:hypothetical protein
MMKRLTIIALVLLLFSCRSTFNGKITYNITIVSNDGDKDWFDYYKNKYGDTLVIDYQKNGDMKRVHKNGTLDYQLYSADDGAIYFVYHNSKIDTFPCVDFTLNRIYKKKVENEEIAGINCKCYEILSTGKKYGDTVLIEACYPKKKKELFVKHKLYKSYQDYYIYELFKENKTPYLKYYIHYPKITIKYDGLKVERTE